MSVISINGVPGCGKTLLGANIGISHYKKENSLISSLIRKYIFKGPCRINNVYSNFPILLDKKRKIYSNVCSIYDLQNDFKFLPNSVILIDEVQIFYDSDEYKIFPKKIANFNQAHRHFGIKDIYYISQHPSRVVKKLRNVVCEFYRIKTRFVIPFLKLGFISYRLSYEFEDYEDSFTKDRELKKLKEIKSKVKFMNFRKIYKSYDTVYLKPLNSCKPLLNNGTYNSVDLTDDQLVLLRNKLFQ